MSQSVECRGKLDKIYNMMVDLEIFSRDGGNQWEFLNLGASCHISGIKQILDTKINHGVFLFLCGKKTNEQFLLSRIGTGLPDFLKTWKTCTTKDYKSKIVEFVRSYPSLTEDVGANLVSQLGSLQLVTRES